MNNKKVAVLACLVFLLTFGVWHFIGTRTADGSETTGSGDPAQRIAASRGQKAAKEGNSIKPLTMPAGSTPTTAQSFEADGTSFPVRTYKVLSATPNDPLANQWWVTKNGTNQSWSVSAGERPTTVAIIDSGFALNHEEFSGRWATNQGEQGPTTEEAPSGSGKLNCTDRGLPLDKSCNLVDDDGNGYVDDFRGWDFISGDNDPQAGSVAPTGKNVSHGTAVSGIMGATGNNAKGIAGIDWNTRILPLQAIGDNTDGTTITVARSIYYAVERGVDVINMSLGTSAEDPYLRQAIHYALDNDVAVVAAAGNENCDCISYPARYPEVVAVGAESQTGGRASFSSYGSSLDILAPGEAMTAPVFRQSNQTSAYANNLAGTSFAAPVVSGMLSRQRALQPSASWGELIAQLSAKAGNEPGEGVFRSDAVGVGSVQSNDVLQRATTPVSVEQRYAMVMSDPNHPLSSKNVYQCASGESASTNLAILEKAGQRSFSINPLEISKLTSDGWTVARQLPVCVGLPGDTVASKRVIDLNRELFNDPAASKNASSTTTTASSIKGRKLHVPQSNNRAGRPTEITSQATAVWLGGWSGNVQTAANNEVTAATARNELVTLVVYNIPNRDCGGHASGGLADSTAYRAWIRQIAAGIGNREALIVLEPDAIAYTDCLSSSQENARFEDIKYAVDTFKSTTKAHVYIDAGHSNWMPVSTMASRLAKSGIANARGFALNVSNFQTNTSSNDYGNRLSALTGNSKFVVDTSRNGKGPAGDAWCNPPGRGLGTKPTTATNGNLDAYLWIKMPGESDGPCNGGPAAGDWWGAYADELIRNANY